jgi:hypothetical protein
MLFFYTNLSPNHFSCKGVGHILTIPTLNHRLVHYVLGGRRKLGIIKLFIRFNGNAFEIRLVLTALNGILKCYLILKLLFKTLN